MKRIIKRLEAKRAKMAKLRDELLKLESEISEHAWKCEDATDSLSRAIDSLSELV